MNSFSKQDLADLNNSLRKEAQSLFLRDDYSSIQEYSAFIDGALWMWEHIKNRS